MKWSSTTAKSNISRKPRVGSFRGQKCKITIVFSMNCSKKTIFHINNNCFFFLHFFCVFCIFAQGFSLKMQLFYQNNNKNAIFYAPIEPKNTKHLPFFSFFERKHSKTNGFLCVCVLGIFAQGFSLKM